MAINDPRYIGIAVRCIKCRWIFRCPAEQPYRGRCHACMSRLRRKQEIQPVRQEKIQETDAMIEAVFNNHIGPIKQ